MSMQTVTYLRNSAVRCDKIDAFLPVPDKMMTSDLVTIEKVQVLQYGANNKTADRP